jgi:fatty acyl-CoA reductase
MGPQVRLTITNNMFSICQTIFYPGMIAGWGHGVLRSLHGNPNLIADLIPVDIVINLMVAAAWNTSVQYKQGDVKKIPVYNCNSGSQVPVTWGHLTKMGTDICSEKPFENVLL